MPEQEPWLTELAATQSEEDAAACLRRRLRECCSGEEAFRPLHEALMLGVAEMSPPVLRAVWGKALEDLDRDLLRRLSEAWCAMLDGPDAADKLAVYVDSVLDGRVDRLWEQGLGSHSSYLSMFRGLSPMNLYPAALQLAQDRTGPVGLPDQVILEILEELLHQSRGVLQKVHAVLDTEDREVLDNWLSIPRPHGLVHLVLAMDRPDHPIWNGADFQMMCATRQHPPAFDRLAQILPEASLQKFTDMLARSTHAHDWEQAVRRRRAIEQASVLEASTLASRARPSGPRL